MSNTSYFNKCILQLIGMISQMPRMCLASYKVCVSLTRDNTDCVSLVCGFKMVLKVTTVQMFEAKLEFMFICVVARTLCCLEFLS